jgi:hypothetical protein
MSAHTHTHTPDPWALGAGYGLHGVRIEGPDGQVICSIAHVEKDAHGPDGRVIGTTPIAEGWANAFLITAAPQLLAIAKAFDAYMSQAGVPAEQDSLNPIAALRWKAQQAIAKATGGAP